MFFIIGGDGREYGPVTVDQVRAWVTAGRANLDTKAKAVGSEEWRRVGDFAEFGGGAGAPGAAAPVPAPLAGTPGEIAATLIARAGSLDIFGCIGRSFELWKSNFLPLVGVTLLVGLVQMIAGMIPILGIFVGLCLNGVFYGGLYYYYLGKMRGEPRQIGDAFAGFSKAFVPLMLATLLTTALVLVLLVPFFGAGFAFFIKTMQGGGPPSLPSPFILAMFFVGFLVMLYFTVAWIFTFPLVIDRGLGPWTALEVSRRVVTKQWFRVFVTIFLGWIITMLGLLGLFIGILFTLPLMIGTVLYAYEDLCNPPGSPSPTPVPAPVTSPLP